MKKLGLIIFSVVFLFAIAISSTLIGGNDRKNQAQKPEITEKVKVKEPQTEQAREAVDCWEGIKGTNKKNFSFEGKLSCAGIIQDYIDRKLVKWEDLPCERSEFDDKFIALKIEDAERRSYKLNETDFGKTWWDYLNDAQANVDAIRDYVNKNDGIKWRETFDKKKGELSFDETTLKKRFRQFKVRHSIWCYEVMDEFDIGQATECYDSIVGYVKDGTTSWAELAIPRRKLRKKHKDAMVRDVEDDFKNMLNPYGSFGHVEEKAQNILSYINRGKLQWSDLSFNDHNVQARLRANE